MFPRFRLYQIEKVKIRKWLIVRGITRRTFTATFNQTIRFTFNIDNGSKESFYTVLDSNRPFSSASIILHSFWSAAAAADRRRIRVNKNNRNQLIDRLPRIFFLTRILRTWGQRRSSFVVWEVTNDIFLIGNLSFGWRDYLHWLKSIYSNTTRTNFS